MQHQNKTDGITEWIRKQNRFNKEELEKLNTLFKKVTSAGGPSGNGSAFSYSMMNEVAPKPQSMDRVMFKELLHDTFHMLTEDIITDRIFAAFDKRNDGLIDYDEWLFGLSVFLKGTLQEQINFAFYIYDMNSDGAITKDEVFTLLRNSLLKLPQDEDGDESIKELVELTMKKLDIDRDSRITLSDFTQAVLKDNLLLEALGQCLPSDDEEPPPTSSHPIYTPLADLKFHYQSIDRPSSVEGSASTALPLIPTQRSKYRALSSQSQEYKKTINETLRMKLKLGQIHDQISAIDQKMVKESKKYRNAVEKHENFQKSFEQFLSKQYDRVKQKLLELEAEETESDQLKEKLADLQRTITEKSLHIYELERAWRHHKKSQLFLSHLGKLLKNDEDPAASPIGSTSVVGTSPAALSTADTFVAPDLADSSVVDSPASLASSGTNSPVVAAGPLSEASPSSAASATVSPSAAAFASASAFAGGSVAETPPETSIPPLDSPATQPNFNIDPKCDTPTLDDLLSNYELHDQQEEPFLEEHYTHVTPAKVEDFLDKLKRQNIRLLRHKLEHEKVKNILEEAEKICDLDASNQAAALAQQEAEVQSKLEAQTNELSQAEQNLRDIVQQGCGFADTDVDNLKKFVEKLYEQIFKPTYEERSHVHMAKCVEEYVQSLLCQLYSFEPHILKKALRRN